VFSTADARAPFVEEADQAVEVGGPSPADSYLRSEAIISAAHATGAKAVHPGYGFLAENADFAADVQDAGLVWVGPSPGAIASMGSKIHARSLMQQAGIPVLPGRQVGAGDPGLALTAAEIGYPLLVKASAGGGGKGMRLVRRAEELHRAVAAAAREAGAAFGDDTLFVERYVERPRHVEIQIMGDEHGNVVALLERECSVQRRHQKVIEECPSPVVEPALRAELEAAAVAAGRQLGYVGAGTVEFLLAPDGNFYFLEVNTRLQVEHPVTELVTGLDLVELQLLVAEGHGLPPEALAPAMRGHAIEARLYAEDPANDYLPVTGLLHRFRPPAGIRVDTGVRDGWEIGPHYDPLLAKVIAWGPTREAATRRLSDALRRFELHGPVTNRDFLVGVLEDDEFREAAIDTHFLDRHDPKQLGAPLIDSEDEGIYAAAAALAAQAGRRGSANVLAALPSGWRNNPALLQTTVFDGPHGTWEIGYRFDRAGRLEMLRIGHRVVSEPVLWQCTEHMVDLQVDGVRLTLSVHRSALSRVHVNSSIGQADLTEHPRFADSGAARAPGSLVSPMPGAVIDVMVSQGAVVSTGQPLLVIEAMKMEHEIVAPSDGTLTDLFVHAGMQVEAGMVLGAIADGTGGDGSDPPGKLR
jgi:acetyl/propionyl-CoA carboxylase alpha subunit